MLDASVCHDSIGARDWINNFTLSACLHAVNSPDKTMKNFLNIFDSILTSTAFVKKKNLNLY